MLFKLFYRIISLNRLDIIKKIRGKFYSRVVNSAGINLRVADGVQIFNPQMISIGDNCYIGSGVHIYAWNEEINIGSDVLIAAGVKLITRKHGFADSGKPISQQGYTYGPIIIEDNVWVGFNAIILPNITVGRNSIIGAGAVVTRDVISDSIVGGVPARLISMRK
jgi:maltose O-acetyltransferase